MNVEAEKKRKRKKKKKHGKPFRPVKYIHSAQKQGNQSAVKKQQNQSISNSDQNTHVKRKKDIFSEIPNKSQSNNS